MIILGWLSSNVTGQLHPLPPYQPSHEEILASYRAALAKDSAVKGTILKTTVTPHWLNAKEAFWYCNLLKDSTTEYMYVDAVNGIKRKAFDQHQLAAALHKTTGSAVNADQLWLQHLLFDTKNKKLSFEYKDHYYYYDLKRNSLQSIDSSPKPIEPDHQFNELPSRWDSYSTDSLSPDKKYAAFIKDNNVFIQTVPGGDAVRYTTDGTSARPYGSLAWDPDSKYVIGYHITPVEDSLVYYILSSVPGTTRGQLHSQPYKQPGDAFTTYEMYIFPVQHPETVKVNTPVIDFFDAPLLHWTKDNTHFFYEKVDRGHQRFRIIEVDVQRGSTKTIVDEQTKTFIYTNWIYTHYLPDTKEIVWISEKDGWRHIYLVDAQTGIIKNEITKGNYVVKTIDSVDEKKREIWFSAMGMNSEEDPYYMHYYRISFDGKKLVNLTPAHASHRIAFSQDKNYYLDTYSEVNTAPVTELRRTRTGEKIMEVERADISAYLNLVRRLPRPFVARGRDGTTDIWGIVCLPAELDSTKRYPIIENIYAGPQDSYVPKSFIGYNREMQSLADLGFIVVEMDGMGTANRSKSFHDVCWKNLADAGFPDRILWMKALAHRYPYADTTRVGLYGTSAGGQNALGGLLFHPEFYKAAVAACGSHDNRVDKQWWNEQWMGYPVGPQYAEQSNVTNTYKLRGDLLLIVGEADTNVPPETTYRVIDALIKAGKTFDFLPVPGMGHGDGGAYGRIRKRDFFVQHLLGVQPPIRNTDELLKNN
ncbi:MAG: DPP IV N-terminal domain-containing protein [Ginsengibacter sp.]